MIIKVKMIKLSKIKSLNWIFNPKSGFFCFSFKNHFKAVLENSLTVQETKNRRFKEFKKISGIMEIVAQTYL